MIDDFIVWFTVGSVSINIVGVGFSLWLIHQTQRDHYYAALLQPSHHPSVVIAHEALWQEVIRFLVQVAILIQRMRNLTVNLETYSVLLHEFWVDILIGLLVMLFVSLALAYTSFRSFQVRKRLREGSDTFV